MPSPTDADQREINEDVQVTLPVPDGLEDWAGAIAAADAVWDAAWPDEGQPGVEGGGADWAALDVGENGEWGDPFAYVEVAGAGAGAAADAGRDIFIPTTDAVLAAEEMECGCGLLVPSPHYYPDTDTCVHCAHRCPNCGMDLHGTPDHRC